MPPAVLDTSALARLFLVDEGHAQLRSWFEGALEGGTLLVAPELVLYELGQTIQRTLKHLRPEAQDLVLHDTLEPVVVEPPPTAAAFDLARVRSVSFYDACFLAMAADRGAELVTFDRRLVAAAKAEGVTTTTW